MKRAVLRSIGSTRSVLLFAVIATAALVAIASNPPALGAGLQPRLATDGLRLVSVAAQTVPTMTMVGHNT